MPATIEQEVPYKVQSKIKGTLCYHCGVQCLTDKIVVDNRHFCCDGCRLVYEVINENGLCDYYKLQEHPGLSQVKAIRDDKYAYLDNDDIARQLYQFTDGDKAIVTFYIPGVHCTSCMWLLEHLNKLRDGVSQSRLNFTAKEVTIHFSRKKISVREIVSLLATLGYEPYISLDEAGKKKSKVYNKQRVFKLGVAGFCFGNIMMMSFPEYLSTKAGIEEQYSYLFRYLNLLLALPVFFYSASEFFVTAWKGLAQKVLNIDAPIALAIVITFGRSIYEIATGTGAGYLDSMSGIVFFMLVGRVVQERAYKSISFSRDYKSYFPIAVDVVTEQGTVSKKLQDLKEDDVVQVRYDEIIPADSIILKGTGRIDYSFVSGESEPVASHMNDMVYAGGKQMGEQLTLKIVKPVAGSYLTSLWNHYAFSKNKSEVNDKESAIHVLSKYFTVILLTLAFATSVYWYFHNPSLIINAVSAMLIVACPCALLLSATFTNGNIIRILGNNGIFLRDATVIEELGRVNHIVFDKTGTITQSVEGSFTTTGHSLTGFDKDILFSLVVHSKHPNSKAIAKWLGEREVLDLYGLREQPGSGIEAVISGITVKVGSGDFIGVPKESQLQERATTYARIGDKVTAFHLQSGFRDGVSEMVPRLATGYKLSMLSGDNNRQAAALTQLFGSNETLYFDQKPIDKLNYIEGLQKNGQSVMMIGDGLNDAGALQQSNVGITLTDDINNFTPSCDAILDAKRLAQLPAILKVAKDARKVIRLSFVVSIVYNIIGLYFAMQGLLKPVAAAILMPCSTISIVIITTGASSIAAWRNGLKA